MSTAPLTAPAAPRVREVSAGRPAWITPAAAGAVLLSFAGSFAISSTWAALWEMWMTDPLKSIGGLVPIVSLLLILRVWRALAWEMDGSWWGLALIAATIAVVHVHDQAVLELVLAPSWSIILPPHSLVALAYAAGAVLLFGGMRLLRAAKFPVALMWFVNPVPHFFNRFIDLPLQHASAMMARSFAHALGQALTPDQLSLMFTPKFGMFIAPGCNGIRGAVTMAFIALVAGHLYRLRRAQWALLTAGALLLGYVFNFVRLCGLVVYYVVALRIAWLQDHAAIADYILGACLFFIATVLLFALLLRWSPAPDLRVPSPFTNDVASVSRIATRSHAARLATFAAVITLGSISYARAMARLEPARPEETYAAFPQQAGEYTLRREWDERLATGQTIFHWADYAPATPGSVVSIGVSPSLGAHDTLICHAARGEDWLWHGPLELRTTSGPASLSASLFNNGATQYLEASTVCSGAICGQTSTERRHFGFIYSRPSAQALLTQSPTRPIPILLRAETSDAALPPSVARAALTNDLAAFLSGVDLAAFTAPYRQR